MSDETLTAPAEGGQPLVEGQSAVVETTPAPAQTEVVQQPVVEPVQEVRVPAIPTYDPTSYWQQQAQSAYNEALRLRQERDALEIQQVPEEEREVFTLKREIEQIRREREEQAQRVAVQEWRSFCAQYVSDQQQLASMSDPLQMVSHSFGDQAARIQQQSAKIRQLEADIATLRGVQHQPAGGPPVTPAGQGGGTPQKSLRTMTFAEQDALYERARMGLLRDNEIPPL